MFELLLIIYLLPVVIVVALLLRLIRWMLVLALRLLRWLVPFMFRLSLRVIALCWRCVCILWHRYRCRTVPWFLPKGKYRYGSVWYVPCCCFFQTWIPMLGLMCFSLGVRHFFRHLNRHFFHHLVGHLCRHPYGHWYWHIYLHLWGHFFGHSWGHFRGHLFHHFFISCAPPFSPTFSHVFHSLTRWQTFSPQRAFFSKCKA